MPVETLVTTAGAAILVTALIQVIKTTFAWDDTRTKRFGPLTAILLGILIAAPAALYVGADPVQAAVNGLFAGLAAMGIYDAGSNVVAGA